MSHFRDDLSRFLVLLFILSFLSSLHPVISLFLSSFCHFSLSLFFLSFLSSRHPSFPSFPFLIDERKLTFHSFIHLPFFHSPSILPFTFHSSIHLPFFHSPSIPSFTFHSFIHLPFFHFHSQGRVISAPLTHVNFADFWLADQMNSMVPIFMDFQYFACFYATSAINSNTWHENKGTEFHSSRSSSLFAVLHLKFCSLTSFVRISVTSDMIDSRFLSRHNFSGRNSSFFLELKKLNSQFSKKCFSLPYFSSSLIFPLP